MMTETSSRKKLWLVGKLKQRRGKMTQNNVKKRILELVIQKTGHHNLERIKRGIKNVLLENLLQLSMSNEYDRWVIRARSKRLKELLLFFNLKARLRLRFFFGFDTMTIWLNPEKKEDWRFFLFCIVEWFPNFIVLSKKDLIGMPQMNSPYTNRM
jgi:hypothetical protein